MELHSIYYEVTILDVKEPSKSSTQNHVRRLKIKKKYIVKSIYLK